MCGLGEIVGFFPGQLVGGTPAHRSNIGRRELPGMSLSGGGFNWSAQHLLILRDEEVFHGDVTD